jgi:hypothetical protein
VVVGCWLSADWKKINMLMEECGFRSIQRNNNNRGNPIQLATVFPAIFTLQSGTARQSGIDLDGSFAAPHSSIPGNAAHQAGTYESGTSQVNYG